MDTKRDKDFLEELVKIKKKMVSSKSILIVGGTGFIGFHLADYLKKKILTLFLYQNAGQKKKDLLKV